jgi:hypothetical protein
MTDKFAMVVPEEVLISKIFHFRGHNVMLDENPADLYEVEKTKNLAVECVKRAAQMNYLDTKKIYRSLVR